MTTDRDHAAFLQHLREEVRHENDPDRILSLTTERIAHHFRASRTGYGEFDADAVTFMPRYHWIDGSVVAMTDTMPFEAFGPTLTASHRRGEIWVHETLDDPHVDTQARATLAALDIAAAITVPLVKSGRLVSLLSVQQNQPRRWSPADVALVVEVAERTWDTLERARALADLAQSREALFQAEKLNALGKLLAGVSHELNNPLSIVVAQTELLAGETAATPVATRVGKIGRAAERCARIVQTFLAMARQSRPHRQWLDLNEIVRAAIEITGYGARAGGIGITTHLADLPPISADADQLHQVVVNLLLNAQQALIDWDGDRTIDLRSGRGDAGVWLEVADTGPGVPADVRRRIFDPFFTTKPEGSGTGIGLSFSQGIVEGHGGQLRLLAAENPGARFRIDLPIGEVSWHEPALPDVRPLTTPIRVLIVDDEADVADTIAEILGGMGHVCNRVANGRMATRQIRHAEFDLVLSDLRMPDMTGDQLYGWIVAERPQLRDRVGFITGDTFDSGLAAFLRDSGRPVLEKPFTRAGVERFAASIVNAAPHPSPATPIERSDDAPVP